MNARAITGITALGGLVVGAILVALLPDDTVFARTDLNSAQTGTSGQRWACPMMDFIGNKPGNCPVCGMKMQKVSRGELTREQQKRMGVETVTITEGPAIATIRASGVVRYDDRSTELIIPRVAGRIVRRHAATLHTGSLIKVGEQVVDLYSPEAFALQGELAAAVKLGDQPLVQALTQRLERLNLGSIAQMILKGGAPLDTITIHSTTSGRVLDEEMKDSAPAVQLPKVGQQVMADTPLLRVIAPYRFMLVLQVPETRARWVRVGQPVKFVTDDLGELPSVQTLRRPLPRPPMSTPAEASVTWIASELNREIRTREVRVHLRDLNELLLPGSLVTAHFRAMLGPDLQIADSDRPVTWGQFILVPKTAVLSTGVRHVAWRVRERLPDGRVHFELAPLALGPRLEDESGNDLYVVRSGLKAGDEVATQGAFLVDSQAQLAGTASLLFPKGATAAPSHRH